MNRIRSYLIFGFFSSLVGAANEVISAILNYRDAVYMSELLESMIKGFVIGVVCCFCLFRVFLKLTNKPIAGFISSFLSIGALMTLITVYDYIEASYSFPNNRWLVVFIIAELMGMIFTAVWYRQMKRYNDKLEKKKASII